MTTLTDETLRELLAKAEKATPGARVFFADEPKHRMTVYAVWVEKNGRPHDFACAASNRADAAFYASLSPQTITTLVTELLSLRDRVKVAEEALANAPSSTGDDR